VPKLLGLDGRKMSKSYDNSIYLRDRGAVLIQKITSMFTDPQRMRRKDPGRPEVCNAFAFHKIYSPSSEVDEIAESCRTAGIGCVECKKLLAQRIVEGMAPIHERQDHYLDHLEDVKDIMADGVRRASKIARLTMEQVREAVKI
jgi:tryptophanyl-tRNA synthetase